MKRMCLVDRTSSKIRVLVRATDLLQVGHWQQNHDGLTACRGSSWVCAGWNVHIEVGTVLELVSMLGTLP
jgi:hypothetical protein